MITVILVFHLILAIALVGIIMIQRSEGGGLGIGGGGSGGGMGGFLTGRSAANLLTRTTAILAALFILTSLGLAKLSGLQREPMSILDQPSTMAPAPAPAEPKEPAQPTAPLAR